MRKSGKLISWLAVPDRLKGCGGGVMGGRTGKIKGCSERMEFMALLLWREEVLLLVINQSTVGCKMSDCDRLKGRIIGGKNSERLRSQGLGRVIHIVDVVVKN